MENDEKSKKCKIEKKINTILLIIKAKLINHYQANKEKIQKRQ